MRQALLILCLFPSSLLAAFAFRVPCEVQAEPPATLRDMEWQQGTTPLVQLDVTDGGRPVNVDTGMTVRLLFGPSATSAYYSVTTNTVATNTYYQVQLPVLGTNSLGSAWWYTVYFEKAGQRYWTGNGAVEILATTSTAENGIVWQQVTATAETDPKWAAVSNAVTQGAALGATAVQTEVDPVAYTVATNALVVANAANVTATGALAVANAALPAAETEGWETGSHAGFVGASITNGLIGAAYLADWADTATVARATSATQLTSASGRTWTELVNGTNYTYWVTNSANVYVVSTSGEGYNGPAAGTVWTNDYIAGVEIAWLPSGEFNLAPSSPYPNVAEMQCFDAEKDWVNYGLGMPTTLTPGLGGSIGAIIIDWVPVTNVVAMASQESAEAATLIIVSEHNASEAAETHPTFARQNALAGYVQTNHTGDVSVTGTLTATAFSGNGSALTGITSTPAPTFYRVPIGDWRTSTGTAVTLAQIAGTSTYGFAMPTNANTEMRIQISGQATCGFTGVVWRVTMVEGAGIAGTSKLRFVTVAPTNNLGAATSGFTYSENAFAANAVYTATTTNIVACTTGVAALQLVRMNVAGGDSAGGQIVGAVEWLPLMP